MGPSPHTDARSRCDFRDLLAVHACDTEVRHVAYQLIGRAAKLIETPAAARVGWHRAADRRQDGVVRLLWRGVRAIWISFGWIILFASGINIGQWTGYGKGARDTARLMIETGRQ